jgi:hypothetical protein
MRRAANQSTPVEGVVISLGEGQTLANNKQRGPRSSVEGRRTNPIAG